MDQRDAEDLIAAFLERHNLRCGRFSKDERQRGKTPDFRAYRGQVLCFFCEVKSLVGEIDEWLADLAAPALSAYVRDDPSFNRVTSAIHRAVKQFDAVNAERMLPNVLALVNYEQLCDERDLYAVLTGEFVTDDGSRDLIYAKFAIGRMKTDVQKIDLFLWIDPDEAEPAFMYGSANVVHRRTLCECFGHDPAAIPPA